MRRLEQLKAGRTTQDSSPIVVRKAPMIPRGVAGEGALEGKIVPRSVSRTSNQRRETRHHGIADTAMVKWEADQVEAKVINISERGMMIEAPIAPGIGGKIEITFEACDPLVAVVIWRKGYRLGLDFGEPLINLFAAD